MTNQTRNQTQNSSYDTQRNQVNYRPLGSIAPYLAMQMNTQRAPVEIDDDKPNVKIFPFQIRQQLLSSQVNPERRS